MLSFYDVTRRQNCHLIVSALFSILRSGCSKLEVVLLVRSDQFEDFPDFRSYPDLSRDMQFLLLIVAVIVVMADN